VTTKEHVRQMIEAHETAAARARSPEKREKHELAAHLLRKEHDIAAPVSFGKSTRNVAAQRAIQEQIDSYKRGDRK
jgi:hypothetical protein